MAIKYVWPGATFNGNGTSGAAATTGGGVGAYNTLGGISIAAGDVIRIKRGTTYTDPTPTSNSPILLLSLVGSAASPTIIEAYANDDGSDDATQPLPIIDHNGGGNGQACIRVQSSQYVIVRNIKGINSVLSGGSAVRVRNSSNVSIYGCEGASCTSGFSVIQDTAAATMSEIVIGGCLAWGNVCGIIYTWMDAANSYIVNLTIIGNTVRDNTMTPGSFRFGGIQHGVSSASATATNSDRGVRGIVIANNECFGNRGYPLTTYGARASAVRPSKIYGNHVYGNNLDGDADSHSIWAGACFGIVIEDNRVHDNIGYIGAANGSQVGIFVDFNSANTAIIGDGNIVRRNVIYDGWMGSTAVTLGAGAGIYLLNNQNCVVESNVIENCRCGIVVARDNPASPSHIIRNNTIKDIVRNDNYSGVGILLNTGNGHTLINNSISGCELSGIFVNSALSGITESYNCVYDSGVAKVVSADFNTLTPGVLDGSDLTVDPQLSDFARPLPTSPLIGAGTHSTYMRDAAGLQRPNPPSIGAYDLPTQRRVVDSDPADW